MKKKTILLDGLIFVLIVFLILQLYFPVGVYNGENNTEVLIMFSAIEEVNIGDTIVYENRECSGKNNYISKVVNETSDSDYRYEFETKSHTNSQVDQSRDCIDYIDNGNLIGVVIFNIELPL